MSVNDMAERALKNSNGGVRKRSHCRAGTHHLDEYFAGVCDGEQSRATSGHYNGCEREEVKEPEKITALGTLRVDLLPPADGQGYQTISLNQVEESDAMGFLRALASSSNEGWRWLVITNNKGGAISVQVKNVYSATFNSPVRD